MLHGQRSRPRGTLFGMRLSRARAGAAEILCLAGASDRSRYKPLLANQRGSLAAELTDAIGKFRGAGRPCDPGPVGGLQSKLSLDGGMADELTIALSPGTPR